MKTKIMLMIVVAFKSQNQFCWDLRIYDGGRIGNYLRVWRKNYLSVGDGDNGDGDPDDNGDDGVHHDGSNLIL